MDATCSSSHSPHSVSATNLANHSTGWRYFIYWRNSTFYPLQNYLPQQFNDIYADSDELYLNRYALAEALTQQLIMQDMVFHDGRTFIDAQSRDGRTGELYLQQRSIPVETFTNEALIIGIYNHDNCNFWD